MSGLAYQVFGEEHGHQAADEKRDWRKAALEGLVLAEADGHAKVNYIEVYQTRIITPDRLVSHNADRIIDNAIENLSCSFMYQDENFLMHVDEVQTEDLNAQIAAVFSAWCARWGHTKQSHFETIGRKKLYAPVRTSAGEIESVVSLDYRSLITIRASEADSDNSWVRPSNKGTFWGTYWVDPPHHRMIIELRMAESEASGGLDSYEKSAIKWLKDYYKTENVKRAIAWEEIE